MPSCLHVHTYWTLMGHARLANGRHNTHKVSRRSQCYARCNTDTCLQSGNPDGRGPSAIGRQWLWCGPICQLWGLTEQCSHPHLRVSPPHSLFQTETLNCSRSRELCAARKRMLEKSVCGPWNVHDETPLLACMPISDIQTETWTIL